MLSSQIDGTEEAVDLNEEAAEESRASSAKPESDNTNVTASSAATATATAVTTTAAAAAPSKGAAESHEENGAADIVDTDSAADANAAAADTEGAVAHTDAAVVAADADDDAATEATNTRKTAQSINSVIEAKHPQTTESKSRLNGESNGKFSNPIWVYEMSGFILHSIVGQ